eukprot:gene3738-4087_t
MTHFNKVTILRALIYSVFLLHLVVECKPKPKKAKFGNKSAKKTDVMTGVYFCVGALALMFVPIVSFFFYNLLRDPDLPKLLREAYKAVKGKTLSYLSTQRDGDSKIQ